MIKIKPHFSNSSGLSEGMVKKMSSKILNKFSKEELIELIEIYSKNCLEWTVSGFNQLRVNLV